MSTPLVSILIPVWNRLGIIEATVRSALAQTITDLEVVIVDNASTDGTWEVIKRLAAEDARIRPFQNESNIGPVRNWRRAAEEASGQFGKILWSDDLITADFLEKTLPPLQAPDVGFVWTGVEIFKGSNEAPDIFYAEDERETTSTSFIKRMLGMEHGPWAPTSPGCAMMRMNDLRDAIIVDIPNRIGCDFAMHGIGNDQLAFLLIALKYPRVSHVPDLLSRFRAHAGSISVHTRWGKCALMYRATQTAFLDGPGKGILGANELAVFNAHTEIMRIRFFGEQYGFKSWRDFHAPDANEGGLDSSAVAPLLMAAMDDGRKERLYAKSSDPFTLSDETLQSLVKLIAISDQRHAALQEKLKKLKANHVALKERLEKAKQHNQTLRQRLRSLMNGWTRLGWKIMPWRKPAWRHDPLGK